MSDLVECIPNISEGRRPQIVEACADAIRQAGVALLDTHIDTDHHRSVFSFAGPPARIEAAALALIDAAVQRIDLRQHTGVHPRIGAVDVMPFVPLRGVTLTACAALARRVGAAAADRHGLPVFLYEAAAVTPSRQNLADIRRGGFEALAVHLTQPAWHPDYGPTRPHPSAGALVIGARRPLVAFNVNLDTTQLAAARTIARSLRERDGGLRAVKALGLPLASRGVVQVSMNLVDYTITPPVVVFDRITAEAARLGIAVLDSELVGLAPRAALPPDPVARLRLPPGREYVLERALEATGLSLD